MALKDLPANDGQPQIEPPPRPAIELHVNVPLGGAGQVANMTVTQARELHGWLSATLDAIDAPPNKRSPRLKKRAKKSSRSRRPRK